MKISLYMARAFALSIILVVCVLVVLVMSATLIESAGSLANLKGGALVALKLALFGAVEFAYQVLPVACFLGALIAGTLMARSGELLALNAAGVSWWRQWRALLLVAVITALAGVALGEVALPWSLRNSERIRLEARGRESAITRFFNKRMKWFRDGDLVLYLPVVDFDTEDFPEPVVYRMNDGIISEVIDGSRLYQDENGWFVDGARVFGEAGGRATDVSRLSLPLKVTPRDLIDVTGNPRHLSSKAIWDLIQRRVHAGFDVTAHQVELHQRLAFPTSAIWMFLLAAPWALNPNRRRSLAANLGVGVIAIAMLLSITHIFRLLALAHNIPAPVGAWGVAAFCLAVLPINGWMYQRYRVRGSIW